MYKDRRRKNSVANRNSKGELDQHRDGGDVNECCRDQSTINLVRNLVAVALGSAGSCTVRCLSFW